jgi:hypothetical protein
MYLTTLLTMWYDWRQALFAITHTHILGYDDSFQGFSISQAGQRVRCEVLNWWAIKKCQIVSDCCSSPKQQSPGRHVTHLGCSSPKQQSPGRHVTHLDTLSWFRTNLSLLLLINTSGSRRSSKCRSSSLWFDQTGFEPMFYNTPDKHTNYYTDDVVSERSSECKCSPSSSFKKCKCGGSFKHM